MAALGQIAVTPLIGLPDVPLRVGEAPAGRVSVRIPILFTVSVVCVLLLVGPAGPRGAGCDAEGNVRFICDQAGPEDLFPVPGDAWVLSSGMVQNGAIRLITIRDKTTTIL